MVSTLLQEFQITSFLLSCFFFLSFLWLDLFQVNWFETKLLVAVNFSLTPH